MEWGNLKLILLVTSCRDFQQCKAAGVRTSILSLEQVAASTGGVSWTGGLGQRQQRWGHCTVLLLRRC